MRKEPIAWITSMQTEHFYFEGIGLTEESANESLGRVLELHESQMQLDSEWWADYPMESRPLYLGGYRDAEKLTC